MSMKNSDKVTLTFGQLKKLIKESRYSYEDDVFEDEGNADGKIEVILTSFAEGGRETIDVEWEVEKLSDEGDYYNVLATVVKTDNPRSYPVGTNVEFELEKDATFDDVESELESTIKRELVESNDEEPRDGNEKVSMQLTNIVYDLDATPKSIKDELKNYKLRPSSIRLHEYTKFWDVDFTGTIDNVKKYFDDKLKKTQLNLREVDFNEFMEMYEER